MKKYSLLLLFIFLSTSAFSSSKTETPIHYLVIIYQENRTFDHYFATYPYAQNNPGETRFKRRKNTPTINGLSRPLKHLNQNLAQPFRLSPQIAAEDENNPDHSYTALQAALDSGLLDQFVQKNGHNCTPQSIVMGYFDGNTVTALWNYAQYFAMSDNFHTTNIAPSTIGAINLISGQTHGAVPNNLSKGLTPLVVDGTVINDVDPTFDMCSVQPTVQLLGINVGDLLNAKGVTWGWFEGGFADCSITHEGPEGPVADYIPHHDPFQYYQSTSNPQHLPPSSVKMIGKTDQANHNYDLSDFWAAVKHGNMPAVSFLKAPAYQDGHPGHSTPLLEQQFLVQTINRLQGTSFWKHMAIIIAYDDSGGWYDHEMPPIINQSQIFADALVAPGSAGSNPPLGGYQGRPAYGYRVPFLLISPWAKENYVDHTVIDQTSILRFIEDNWNLGRIGDFSFDAYAASISNMFDFHKRHDRKLILHSNGSVFIKE